MKNLFGLLLLALLVSPLHARAADGCAELLQRPFPTDYALRVATVACNESSLWYRAFIDVDGRLASTTVMEVESSQLHDGVTPAWKRVAAYWRESGMLGQMAGFPGATDCNYSGGERWQSASCRAFLVDQPWSAAFVSYVMAKAGVPGFRGSASHVDYVRDAYLRPDVSPYTLADPFGSTIAVGDMLCFVRASSQTFGYDGLRRFFDGSGGAGLKMHCDIVVSNNKGVVSAVGGNVLQGVTLRQLPVNRSGLLWGVPRKSVGEPACSPDAVSNCNFNRQDWSALLKLKQLPPAPVAAPSSPIGPDPRSANCCINCDVGAVPAIPRCPVNATPAREN